jgi:hypothetical protein
MTFGLGCAKDQERHIISQHLPYQLFCPQPSCLWRGGLEDDFEAHLKSCHPGHEHKPVLIYDTKLVLGYILEDGAPVERAEKYALDFIRERALELGKVEEWEDLCGRRAATGRCRCDG